ncbi:hypothetical protein MCOR34_011538, partial [Pyricularia oryzae]
RKSSVIYRDFGFRCQQRRACIPKHSDRDLPYRIKQGPRQWRYPINAADRHQHCAVQSDGGLCCQEWQMLLIFFPFCRTVFFLHRR